MLVEDILRDALEKSASDIFIVAGFPVAYKINSALVRQDDTRMMPPDTKALLYRIYELAGRKIDRLEQSGDDDFSFFVPGINGRFRCSAYRQRGSLACVIRVVSFNLPDAADMGIPDSVMDLYRYQKGLILVTGSAGSGKTTTLACLIDRINRSRDGHIITLEDPIEFIHSHKQSIVSQREIEHDTESYAQALRAALRQSPNVILLGEMRDFETIQTAVTAAETGQLVFSTLHTPGAAKTVDRIIDVFPSNQQQQIRTQLSMVLQAVVSQQLIPGTDGKLVPAFEVMVVNNAIRNLIKDGKINQIDNAILTGGDQGMMLMDSSILDLYRRKLISRENALLYAVNRQSLQQKL
ncbi:MAG: PilT/PilU family type 4a pilus ATPase [Oscillospiraceae bacterium]|nr:PilT/PilU family type 4a pilus ATPase [Oscillospiraceae bacterium]